MNTERKQLLNFSIIFKAVLGEQNEAHTPSSGDAQCHRCIGNKIAEQAGWLDRGVSARECVTKSRYLCINSRWKGWAGPTARRKPTSPSTCYFKQQISAQLHQKSWVQGCDCRCSCANIPKSTSRLRKWEGWKGLVCTERPSTHTKEDVLACKVVCVKCVVSVCVSILVLV